MASIHILLRHYRNFPTKSRKMLVSDMTILKPGPILWLKAM